jgi:tRNA pseudouridine13 synthase
VKLKQRPEDFLVEEIDLVNLGPGPFTVYLLEKRGIGTIEAVSRIAREFGVPRSAVGYGGLKDKWARTRQKITIENGPERGLKEERFQLSFAGRSAEPVRRAAGNRFDITIRDLWKGDLKHLGVALEEIRSDGVPNYFDSQRFGSARGARDFIARRLIRGEFEEALKLAIAAPSEEDRSRARREKETLRDRWGDWARCPESRIVRFLRNHPGEWRRAMAMIDPDLRNLFAGAYQSFLWNGLLTRLIRESVAPSQVFRKRYAMGELYFYRRLPASGRDRLKSLQISLPRRGAAYEDVQVRTFAEKTLSEEGIRMEDLKIRGLPSTSFARGSRSAIVVPANLSSSPPETDELNAGRLKIRLGFELPRGSYATILVKRIFH